MASSPISSKQANNTNSRNNERTPLQRRSFSGNSSSPLPKPSILSNHKRFEPSTPVNSPSEIAARRSATRESSGLGLSSLKDSEEKENAMKDHNVKDRRLQSQAKGSKNFMSSTISAASKFTPSPRKKAVVDRDDPVRTSMSLSNGKVTFFSDVSSEFKSEMGDEKIEYDDELKKSDIFREDDPPLPKPAKRVSFSDVLLDPRHDNGTLSSSALAEADSSNMEPCSEKKVPCSNVLDSTAPLDADPPFPPYDPVKNYLSPRPRYIHYKPNPRTEMLSTIGKGIEGSLITELASENSSDSDGSEESQSGDSSEIGESKADDSADSVLGMEETEEDLQVNEPSETLPVSTDLSDDISDETEIRKAEKKSWPLSKLGIFSMLVMIVIAGVSISVANPPVLNEIMPKDLRLSDLKVNLDWIASNVKQFSVNSITSMSKLINELQRGKESGTLRYVNLTELLENPWVGNQFLNDEMVGKEIEEKNDEGEFEDDVVDMKEVLSEEVESYVEVDTDESFENELHAPDETAENDEIYPEILDNVQEEEITTMVNNDLIRDENYQDEPTCNVSLPDQETEPVVEMIEASTSAETNFENIPVEANIDSTAYAGDSISELQDLSSSTEDVLMKTESITPEKVLESPLSHNAMGICCVFATILLGFAAAFIFIYKRSPGLTVQSDHPSLSMKRAADQDITVSHNLQTEAEDVGESCSSEMSSVQKRSASYTKKEQMMRTSSETQKKATKQSSFSSRREELASSSSEFSFSPSYGSFTTYEKIPIKDANGEEKFLTPVRRSSRIRNHQQIMSS